MSDGSQTAQLARPDLGANDVVARRLEEVARLLEIQGADVHRVRACGDDVSVEPDGICR
jgi:hypothetical protein